MKQTILFIATTLCLLHSKAIGQIGVEVGRWRTHLSYEQTQQVAVGEHKAYAISSGALYSVGIDEHLIETYSKIDGLSDSDITKIYHIVEKNVLLVGYRNGNIDLLFDNGDIVNISDIYKKNISVAKQTNDVCYYNGYIYLALPFGIVKINIDKKEIADTFYFLYKESGYIEVNSLSVVDGQFYATTIDNIFTAPTQSVNLANFALWQKVENIPSGGNKKAIAVASNLYLLKTDSTLYSFDNNSWSDVLDSKVYNIFSHKNRLSIIKKLSVSIDNKNIFFDEQPQMTDTDRHNNLWVALPSKGIAKISHNKTAIQDIFKPNGPITNNFWKIKSTSDKIFAVAGGRWTVPFGIPAIVMIFENNQWTNITREDILKYLGTYPKDFVDITIDPKNKNHFFTASYGGGLFEFKDNTPFKWYNADNTALENNYISSIAFDKNDRLWITNPKTSAVFNYADKEGESYRIAHLPYSESNAIYTPADILIDQRYDNIKYFIVARGVFKVIAFDNNTNHFINKTNFIDQDGKIFNAEHYVCGTQDLKTQSIWIGTSSGPLILPSPHNIFDNNYRCQRIKIPRNDGTNFADYLLENEMITAIAIDGNNMKWIGTETSGAYLINEDGTTTIKHFTTDNSPLLSNFIRTISIVPNTGEVFFGTNKGLVSWQGEAIKPEATYQSLHAFPNPVRPDYQGDIAIKGLAKNSVVKIIDITGNLIFETFSQGGMAIWNGKDKNGNRVATGVYNAICNTIDGLQTGIVKILFIK